MYANQAELLIANYPRWRWLKEKYVAVKINASIRPSQRNTSTVRSELNILRLLYETNRRHEGWSFVRHLLDSFTLGSSSGEQHLSLIFEPLREPLWIYQQRFDGGVIPSDILKVMLQMTLQGLIYLHSECYVIHTGLLVTDNEPA